MDWAEKLAKMAAFYQQPGSDLREPFYLWDVQPAAPFEWPSSVPYVKSLARFYAVCSGGEFGPMIRFVPVRSLANETERWRQLLAQYDSRGDILRTGEHIVFANDADGSPWILHVATGRVASFYWKGGDWQDPPFPSHDDFMEYVLDPGPDAPVWAAAVSEVMGA